MLYEYSIPQTKLCENNILNLMGCKNLNQYYTKKTLFISMVRVATDYKTMLRYKSFIPL